MSQLKVNTIRHTGASSDAVTLASDGTCTAKITNNLSNRNLVINGSMICAQRGVSSTSTGYQTVDRWQMEVSGANAAFTQSPHALSSSDTGPYEKGFRKSYHILNAGQSGPDAGDYARILYTLEAQDVANSGWNYKSASSYITVSFWVKSSVGTTYGISLQSQDGTGQNYTAPFTLSADTWTKVTKTIPGLASGNIDMANDTGSGLMLAFQIFYGTNYTDSGFTNNAWAAYTASSQANDMATTWWTTANATFEVTGLQLEVGDVATDFEHRSYGDELARCQRYYVEMGRAYSGESGYVLNGLQAYGSTSLFGVLAQLPVRMRAKPTCTVEGSIKFSDKAGSNVFAPSSTIGVNQSNPNYIGTSGTTFGSAHFLQGGFAACFVTADGTNYIKVDAEL